MLSSWEEGGTSQSVSRGEKKKFPHMVKSSCLEDSERLLQGEQLLKGPAGTWKKAFCITTPQRLPHLPFGAAVGQLLPAILDSYPSLFGPPFCHPFPFPCTSTGSGSNWTFGLPLLLNQIPPSGPPIPAEQGKVQPDPWSKCILGGREGGWVGGKEDRARDCLPNLPMLVNKTRWRARLKPFLHQS